MQLSRKGGGERLSGDEDQDKQDTISQQMTRDLKSRGRLLST
jgi:hypothetical protein